MSARTSIAVRRGLVRLVFGLSAASLAISCAQDEPTSVDAPQEGPEPGSVVVDEPFEFENAVVIEVPPEEEMPPEPAEHHDRFTGIWVVNQPWHAGYEETWYAFDDDGELSPLGTFPGPEYQVGHASVQDTEDCTESGGQVFCSPLFTCFFGDHWRSSGDDVLIIDGDCDDGEAREIELTFGDDASQNAVMAVVEITRIGEHTEDLVHNDWEWEFTKCYDATGEQVGFGWQCEDLYDVVEEMP